MQINSEIGRKSGRKLILFNDENCKQWKNFLIIISLLLFYYSNWIIPFKVKTFFVESTDKII